MRFFDDIRDSRTLTGKLFLAAIFLLAFAVVAVLGFSAYLLYGIVSPNRPTVLTDRENVLGNPDEVSFTIPGVGVRTGWLFPGHTTAPTIILCHGYGSQRGELLTLVTSLQEHRYNVFIFDFSGHGTSKGTTSLGYRETQELQAVIDELAKRDDLDRSRFGLWGANMGAYVALRVAVTEKRVRAVVIDSVYDRPDQMVQWQFERAGLDFAYMGKLIGWGFQGLNYGYRKDPPLSQMVPALGDVHKLFVQGRDHPQLAESTLKIFLASPDPREQVIVSRANYVSMPDDEKRSYEQQVTGFFLTHLAPVSAPARSR